MATAEFNPYTDWLKIEAEQCPPHFYTLLGVAVFETDGDAIQTEYEKRYALVRKYHVGEQRDYALQLISELSKAFDCLTSDQRKRDYDLKLLSTHPELADQAPSELADATEAQDGAQGDDVVMLAPGQPAPASLEWFLKFPNGHEEGPVSTDHLERTVTLRQLDANTQLWHEGWDEARLAGELFPQLVPTVMQPLPPALTPIGPAPAASVPVQPKIRSLDQLDGNTMRPYVRQDPYGVGRNWKISLISVCGIIGGLLVVLAVLVGSVHSFWFAPALTISLVGQFSMAIALLEWPLFFDGPLGQVFRQQFGDQRLRTGMLAGGSVLLIVGYLIVFSQAGSALSRQLFG